MQSIARHYCAQAIPRMTGCVACKSCFDSHTLKQLGSSCDFGSLIEP
jgi:hypothetical protein